MSKYDSILVPLDGSRLAEYVISHAESFAAAFGSEVTLLYVVETEARQSTGLTSAQKSAHAEIGKYLEGIASPLIKKGIKARWLVSYGDPAEEILRHIGGDRSSLVVMSTHGEGGRANGAGSVAAAVVAKSKVPVTLLRPPEKILDK